jgi:glycosyltransferase involved in cell wall biosynthesis
VNDGSSDATAEIIDRWAAKHNWIVPVHLSDLSRQNEEGTVQPAESKNGRARRARQAKEIEAFYKGLRALKITDWDFLVKLDGDVTFEPDYFERCFKEFRQDPKLGIGGGSISNVVEGRLEFERTQQFHVRGATKIYRRTCWDDIGGVLPSAGWDTIDEVKANMHGWSTRSFPDVMMVHHRFTGAANGMWQNAIKNGIWSYICGYHPMFMAIKCIKRVFKKPAFIGAAGLMYGFLLGYVQRVPQIEDQSVINYLRQQQLRRLSLRSSVWK